MKIGLSTLLFPRWKLDRAVEACLRLGSEWVEIVCDFPTFMPGKPLPPLKKIKKILSEAGSGASVHASFWDMNPASFYSEVRGLTVKKIKLAIKVCDTVGGELIVVHPGRCPIPELKWMMEKSRKLYEHTLREVLPEAKKRGIKIAVENGSYAFGPYATLDGLKQLMWKWRNLGACLDVGHAFLEARRKRMNPDVLIKKAVRGLGEKLVHVHVHDNRGHYDEHLVPGGGKINFKEVSEALRRVHYEGAIVVELFRAGGSLRTGKLGLQRAKRIFK